MTKYKQVILVRTDLNMTVGKLATQVAHAAVRATQKSKQEIVKEWDNEGAKKVILQVKTKTDLFKYVLKAKFQGLTTVTIKDGAKTFFKVPTTTCAAIGPDTEEKIDKVTKELKLI